jgi:hypothetical protein
MPLSRFSLHRYFVRVFPPRYLLLAGSCWLLSFAPIFAADAAAEPFIAYLQRAANPDNLGFRADGRFYPYASPAGRRIGYRQVVTDKKLFRDGLSQEEARQALLRQIAEVENEWREKLSSEFKRNFDELPTESREILVDFGVSEGVAKVKPDLIRAALELDWKRILDPAVYVRYESSWPLTERNKPFYERWVGKGVTP